MLRGSQVGVSSSSEVPIIASRFCCLARDLLACFSLIARSSSKRAMLLLTSPCPSASLIAVLVEKTFPSVVAIEFTSSSDVSAAWGSGAASKAIGQRAVAAWDMGNGAVGSRQVGSGAVGSGAVGGK